MIRRTMCRKALIGDQLKQHKTFSCLQRSCSWYIGERKSFMCFADRDIMTVQWQKFFYSK